MKRRTQENPDSESSPAVQSAESLLRRGKRYDQAIALLEDAASQAPQSLKTASLLCSAYACKFASLAFALHQQEQYRVEETSYPKKYKQWQEAQSDPENFWHRKPAPLAPGIQTTFDDNRKYTLSKEDALSQLNALAQKAFAIVRKSSEQKSVDISLVFQNSCSLLLLYKFSNLQYLQSSLKNSAFLKITDEEIQIGFEKCAISSPEMSHYW